MPLDASNHEPAPIVCRVVRQFSFIMKTSPPFWFEPAPWIDGAWRQPGRGGDSVTVRNPATGALLAPPPAAEGAAGFAGAAGGAGARGSWKGKPLGTAFGPEGPGAGKSDAGSRSGGGTG